MKTIITSILSVAVVAFVLTSPSFGEEKKKEKGEKVTLSGTATCAKCDLGTEKECTNVLQVKDGDKTATYYLAGKADEGWHKNICKGSKEVTMTGRVQEKGGKKTFVVSKIEE